VIRGSVPALKNSSEQAAPSAIGLHHARQGRPESARKLGLAETARMRLLIARRNVALQRSNAAMAPLK